MSNRFVGKKKWIAAAVVALAAAAVVAAVFMRRSSAGTETAYVDTVANITGQNGALGIANKYAGIVESQQTWSVSKNMDAEVEEIFVHTGQEVEEGDVLFKYDISKYEEELEEAKIELERMDNDYNSTAETLEQLRREKQKASSSEQANYTVQIKEQELSLKDKELDIKLKQAEYDKLEGNIENAEVTSGISGVIKSINDGNSAAEEDDNSFITVMKVGDYRVKGTVSEQNIGEITPGARVVLYSRVNDDTWKGTIQSVDTENPESSQNNYFGSTSANKGSRYPFYVELESGEGLILGQHVYVQLEEEETNKDIKGIWVNEYLIDRTDPEHPFVWKDVNGRLRKQNVTLGDMKEELGQVQVLEGLALTDSVAVPDGTLKEGMRTAPMDEMPEEAENEEGAMSEEDMDYEDEMGEDESGLYEEGEGEAGLMEEYSGQEEEQAEFGLEEAE